MGDREAAIRAETVHRDDSGRAYLWFNLDLQFTDRELAGFLLRNTHTEKLRIDFHGLGDGNWRALLDAIRMRQNLKIFEIIELDDMGGGRPEQTSAAGTNQFVLAASQNGTIEFVTIATVALTGEAISRLLDRTDLNHFCLCGINLEEPDRDIPQLTDALKQNRTITRLSLQDLPERYLVECLDALVASNSILEELEVLPENGRSIAVSTSLERFLQSTPTLRRLRFSDDEDLNEIFFDRHSFQPISEAILHAANITSLQFSCCTFEDEASASALKRVLLKPGLQKINIAYCELVPGTNLKLLAREASRMIQPSLRSLEVNFSQLERQFLGTEALSSLLCAVEKSDLQYLDIGIIDRMEQCNLLTGCIRKMANLRHLKVRFNEEEHA